MRLFGELGLLYYSALCSAQSVSTSTWPEDEALLQPRRLPVVTKTVHRTCPTTTLYAPSIGWIATNGTTVPYLFSPNSSTTSLLYSVLPDLWSTFEESALQSTRSASSRPLLSGSSTIGQSAPDSPNPSYVFGSLSSSKSNMVSTDDSAQPSTGRGGTASRRLITGEVGGPSQVVPSRDSTLSEASAESNTSVPQATLITNPSLSVDPSHFAPSSSMATGIATNSGASTYNKRSSIEGQSSAVQSSAVQSSAQPSVSQSNIFTGFQSSSSSTSTAGLDSITSPLPVPVYVSNGVPWAPIMSDIPVSWQNSFSFSLISYEESRSSDIPSAWPTDERDEAPAITGLPPSGTGIAPASPQTISGSSSFIDPSPSSYLPVSSAFAVPSLPEAFPTVSGQSNEASAPADPTTTDQEPEPVNTGITTSIGGPATLASSSTASSSFVTRYYVYDGIEATTIIGGATRTITLENGQPTTTVLGGISTTFTTGGVTRTALEPPPSIVAASEAVIGPCPDLRGRVVDTARGSALVACGVIYRGVIMSTLSRRGELARRAEISACSTQCLNTPECVGFSYSQGQCIFFSTVTGQQDWPHPALSALRIVDPVEQGNGSVSVATSQAASTVSTPAADGGIETAVGGSPTPIAGSQATFIASVLTADNGNGATPGDAASGATNGSPSISILTIVSTASASIVTQTVERTLAASTVTLAGGTVTIFSASPTTILSISTIPASTVSYEVTYTLLQTTTDISTAPGPTQLVSGPTATLVSTAVATVSREITVISTQLSISTLTSILPSSTIVSGRIARILQNYTDLQQTTTYETTYPASTITITAPGATETYLSTISASTATVTSVSKCSTRRKLKGRLLKWRCALRAMGGKTGGRVLSMEQSDSERCETGLVALTLSVRWNRGVLQCSHSFSQCYA